MKLFTNLFCIAVAGILGYIAEPNLRLGLTGIQPTATEKAKKMKVVLQMPDGISQIDIASLTPEQLPKHVSLNVDVKVTDAVAKVVMILQAGSRVKLIRIEDGNVVVSPNEGPFLGLVPITDTDLVQQLAENPPTTSPAPVTPPTPVVPEPPVPIPDNSQETVPPAPKETPIPDPTPPPDPTPIPDPAPAPEPAPADDQPAPPPPESGTSDLVKAMQDSVKAAQIKSFTFDQVLDWTSGTDEIHDGQTYQTGLASYKAETIFGVKTIQAKALIKGGKVQRWIGANSGKPIK
jgi:hypothetical protein